MTYETFQIVVWMAICYLLSTNTTKNCHLTKKNSDMIEQLWCEISLVKFIAISIFNLWFESKDLWKKVQQRLFWQLFLANVWRHLSNSSLFDCFIFSGLVKLLTVSNSSMTLFSFFKILLRSLRSTAGILSKRTW